MLDILNANEMTGLTCRLLPVTHHKLLLISSNKLDRALDLRNNWDREDEKSDIRIYLEKAFHSDTAWKNLTIQTDKNKTEIKTTALFEKDINFNELCTEAKYDHIRMNTLVIQTIGILTGLLDNYSVFRNPTERIVNFITKYTGTRNSPVIEKMIKEFGEGKEIGKNLPDPTIASINQTKKIILTANPQRTEITDHLRKKYNDRKNIYKEKIEINGKNRGQINSSPENKQFLSQ